MSAASVPPANADAVTWPLTGAQQGLWYARCLAPDNPAFNCAHALWIDGDLDVDAFRDAADRAARECQSLALVVRDDGDGVCQWLDADRVPLLESVDLRGQDNPAAAARAFMQADMNTAVDPACEQLARQCLLHVGDNRWCWYQRAHHLATDGYGMALWAQRVSALHAAQVTGRPAGRPLTMFADVLAGDEAYRAGDAWRQDGIWWRQHLADMPPVAPLAAGAAVAAHACHRRRQRLADDIMPRLQEAAERSDIGWPDLLTALVALYCQRMAGAEATVVGVPFMDRFGTPAARASAVAMNVLPLVVAASGRQSLRVFVESLAHDQVATRCHGRYRGEQLRRDLGQLGGRRRLHGALVNVQPFYRPVHLAGCDTRLEILGTGPVDDITFGFRGTANGLDFEIEANPDLYDMDAVDGHLRRLPVFLDAALNVLADGGTVADVPLASPVEAERHLHVRNATQHPVADVSLAELLEARMAATPAAPALVFGDEVLDYAELEYRSRALALALRGQGAGPDTLVAVALPRSLELAIALVAVVRAGAAWLPLDPAHPAARLERVLHLAQPACALIADEAAPLPGSLPQLAVADWPQVPQEELRNHPAPQDAAYVIYTSGSTGEPKGVVIEHRAIVNRLAWMREHYDVDAGDRILQKTPATFDVSVWEFFLPLTSGAQLVMAPPEAHRDPAWLARLIRRHGITICHFVPSMLEAFVNHPDAQGLALRHLFVSGEALPAALRDRVHATLTCRLHNLYGPTEAAVDVSWWPAAPDDDSEPVPIGFPVWNTRLYVLDKQLRAVPPGVAGDLYLGGVQLARGYLGRDDLTAEAFVPDPHRPAERMYKTGDVARWRASDGAVEYLGRSDHQVKFHGQRLELGEITAVLLGSGRLIRAETVMRDDHGEQRLVAYVEPLASGGTDNLQSLLHERMATRLPAYMQPSAIIVMHDWPVTANGKLDRKALPLPAVSRDAAGRAPASATERCLAMMMADVLTLPADVPVGADDDFFALGGDSLSAVQLLLRINEQWHRDPGLGTLFATPMVAGLAAAIDAAEAGFDDGLKPLLRLASGDPARAPLFVIHPAGGIVWGYRALARAVRDAWRSVWGLQSPGLDPSNPLPDSIDALASAYVDRIEAIWPAGPVHLAGWSVGGIIAQAMAVELERRRRTIGLVALLDAYPADCWRDKPEPTPQQALRALLAIAGEDPESHPELDTRARLIAFLRAGDTTLGHLPAAALEGVVRVVTDTNRLIRQHGHRPMRGTLTHIRAARDHADSPALRADRWKPHAGSVEQLAVDCRHADMTGDPATASLAPWLIERMEKAS